MWRICKDVPEGGTVGLHPAIRSPTSFQEAPSLPIHHTHVPGNETGDADGGVA